MNKKKLYLSTPTTHQEEIKYIKEAFDTNWVAPLGKNVDEFEKETASYVGTGYAAALVSGTSALHLAYKLAGVTNGDIVFCSDLTFSATVNPIVYEQGVPVFIDSEPETWNMCPNALKKAFERYARPKAVVLVHLYGIPAKIDEISEICNYYGVPLIEDAAESLGAKYKGKQTGTFGKYSVLSFNGNKIITSSGGGMLLSDNEDAIKKARYWATQSREPALHYQHTEIGYNYRMSNIVAGIGRGQLLHLEEHIDKKKYIYKKYKDGLNGLNVMLNPYLSDSEPNFWLSCLMLKENSGVKPVDIITTLADDDIESRPIWKPMHLQPVFSGYDYVTADSESVSEYIYNNGLCLPSDIKMTDDDIDRVIDMIKKLIR